MPSPASWKPLGILVLGILCAPTTGSDDPTTQEGRVDSKTFLAKVRADRQKLAAARAEMIKTCMPLSEAESNVFWPIHQRHERALTDAGDVGLPELVKALEAHETGRLRKVEARAWLDTIFNFEQKRVQILRETCDEITTTAA